MAFNKETYDAKYVKEHYTNTSLRLNLEKDKDIIEYLQTVPNKNEYIKSVIRIDMLK